MNATILQGINFTLTLANEDREERTRRKKQGEARKKKEEKQDERTESKKARKEKKKQRKNEGENKRLTKQLRRTYHRSLPLKIRIDPPSNGPNRNGH